MRKNILATSLMLGTIAFSQALSFAAASESSPDFDATRDDEPLVCPVHKVKLVSGSIPVRFGRVAMFEFDEDQDPLRSKLVCEYLRAKRDLFPETRRWVNGGCSPTFWVGVEPSVMSHYCEACRRIEDEWFTKHPAFLKRDRLP